MTTKPAGQVDKRRIIAVIGSGAELTEEQRMAPREVGRWIGNAGFHLLTGGGAGVMEAVSEGFCSVPHQGCSIGIIPAGKPATQYPNRWIELPIRTHLKGANPRGHDSRNHININTASAVVAFPGRGGTRAELELTLARTPPCPLVVCLANRETIGGLNREAVAALGVNVVDSAAAVARFLENAFFHQT
jgi:uncharacterized protein (TIGR00725 family)